EASAVCAETIGRPVDLLDRVRRRQEATLAEYAEAVALVVAMEMAQIRLLKEFHGIDYSQAKLAYGYSLGELSALACSGVLSMRDALRVPLAMSADCAELAQ